MREIRSRDDAFTDYVRRRRPALVATARSLTSGDVHLAEDLVQTALTRLYLAWPRVRTGSHDAYSRRVLVNALIDESRRPTRRETSSPEVPDRAAEPLSGEADSEGDLIAALGTLPSRMRTAVVLRHVEGLSVEETAHAMRCSTGNVKSQTARGLEKLRECLDTATPTTEENSWTR